MIRSFKHKGLKAFYDTGNTAGIQAMHAPRLRVILATLAQATKPDDMNAPSFRLHPLKGARKGEWAVTVQTNWRVTFRFTNGEPEVVNYEDYH
ncbi:MAG: type II toxin-antitoxin system RelE/ParE family toxin [Pseudomonadota bacterium]